MRYQTVQPSVIFDSRQVTVMLYRNQRICFERFQCEGVRRRTECLSIKYRVISFEQLLDDVQHRRFTRACCTIKHHKFLDLLGIAGNDRADSPFDLVTFLWRIENTHQSVVSLGRPFFQRIRQLLAGIVFLSRLDVGKYNFFVKHVKIVAHVFLAIPVPLIDHARFRIPHMKNLNAAVKTIPIFLCVLVQFPVDQLKCILLVRRP